VQLRLCRLRANCAADAADSGALMQATESMTCTVPAELFWMAPIQPVPSLVGDDLLTNTFSPALAALLSQPPPTAFLPPGQRSVPKARLLLLFRSSDALTTT